VRLDPHVWPLLQPVRPAMVCRHLGQIGLVLAVLLAVPTSFATLSGDRPLALRLLLTALLPGLALGACARLPRGERPLQANEAMVVTVLAFVLAAALMTVPLMAPGVPALDAWFEAVSGVTTTGLSLVPDPQAHTLAFLFARSWMQWFGGLGMVVLSLALAVGRPADMRRLADAAGAEEDLAQGVRLYARRVLGVYLLVTALGVGIVWTSGLPLFEALIHTLSAVSTGGFGAFGNSLAGLDRPVQLALAAVCIVGALPLLLFWRTRARGLRELVRDPELRALAGALALVTLLLWWLGRLAPTDALMQAAFAQTTAGFSTVDVAGLDPAAKCILVLSMAVGGGVGSTAGGVKLMRLLILVRAIQLAILRGQMPRHAVVYPAVGGRTLDPAQIEHALVLILLFGGVCTLSWLPFVVAGYAPLDALLEVVSATGTVGLSTGITAPALEPGLKALLTVDMLLGRVEIFALLVLVYPGSWYKRA
jgi:trk system potassium uptake protein TrkH